MTRRSLLSASLVLVLGATTLVRTAQEAGVTTGVREAAWSPDGKRLAITWFDAIWTVTPEGKDAKRVVSKPEGWVTERDPAWSPDGKSIAFAATTNGQFDVWIAPAGGGQAKRVTNTPGDERWPSWTKDARLVFSHRTPGGAWRLFSSSTDGGSPVAISPDGASEWQGRVSPDGKRVAFVSDREPEANNDADIFVRDLNADGKITNATRVTRSPGAESHPTWAADSARVAYAASRAGALGVWVSAVPASGAPPAGQAAGQPGRGGRGFAPGGGGGAPVSTDLLASRHGGVPAWSANGEWLAIATFAQATAGYNGNPLRNDDDPPTALTGGEQFKLWKVLAPRAIDQGAASLTLPAPDAARWVSAFDQVWQTLKTMYYGAGTVSAAAWDALRAEHRQDAAKARDAAAVEAVIDRLMTSQPLIKPDVQSSRAVVASGHALASAAGAAILEKGGNVIDAGIAVSFALGVVEPEASSIGGDGQAILFLKGMTEPIVIEYKDMTPGHATNDNPRLFTPAGQRTAFDGPTVVAIPGVVAGLDLLYQKYGSKKVAWADLVAPAIELADKGFVLDEALPTSVAEGRDAFVRYAESAKVFMPGGRVPRAGDRFVNKDYAETLRVIAKEGGQSFYRGTIAKRIAEDMAANGGIITAEDLAQYRAMERKPLAGRYRGHLVYSVPPPVSNGLQMVETLNILDNFQPRAGARYTADADYFHHVIESWRVRDGGARIADPERWPVDLGNHLEPPHALERFKLIDPKKVFSTGGGRGGAPVPGPGVMAGGAEWRDPGDGSDGRRVQTGTTAFVVADAEGNMIAFTQTLSTWGGSYYVSKGLGFIYNDHFRGGRGGTGFGAMLPLMRTSTTSVPTLVFEPTSDTVGAYGVQGYVPRIAVGCAGNAWIPASVYNIILNVVDGQMTAQQAIEAPRFLIGGGPGGRSNVQIEDRFPRSVLADLESRGHSFTRVGRKGEVKYGYAAVAVVNAAKSTVQGGADPRRSHAVAAPGK
jgi:gamma-glutamyltranspeptidase